MVLADIIETTKRFLTRRATAYRFVFGTQDRNARVVLEDLARFCRAVKSTAHADPYVAARLDGRREVWLRISEHLNLTTDDLYRLYGGVQKTPGE